MFINNKKKTEKSPDLTGSLKVGETEYLLSGWRRTDRNGNEWISVSITEKTGQQPAASQPNFSFNKAPRNDGPDDSIPF
jgi:hypothetical protein